ncbi:hypothetical protein NADFUDRAFT_52903 [Nadsonia fulvescens var. elongata DSM 6958]|uniref:Peroxisomal biogenesis factor 11 n=1 Tax=Nadsonia fulvescens var. elongata DSM 6958 TaxID=857566 RepID=A0A1E3PET3_9ASCO|nr:hypothetical protein NADFUDRAFT_52903 [Nadsonia fulvescens var. elongata DSM 6958]
MDIFIPFLGSLEGKDKTAKLVQYMGKLLIFLDSSGSKFKIFQILINYYKVFFYKLDLKHRLPNVINNMSMFRKIIRFGDWVGPYRRIMNGVMSNALNLMKYRKANRKITQTCKVDYEDVVDCLNTFADDVYLLGKLGVVTHKKVLHIAERHAAYWWMVGICISSHKAINDRKILNIRMRNAINKRATILAMSSEKAEKAEVEHNLHNEIMEIDSIIEALKLDLYNSNLTLFKLANDFVFDLIDCLDLNISGIYFTVTGLLSGICAFLKLWEKNRVTNMKS